MRRLGEKLGTRLDAERSAIRCHSDEEYSGNDEESGAWSFTLSPPAEVQLPPALKEGHMPWKSCAQVSKPGSSDSVRNATGGRGGRATPPRSRESYDSTHQKWSEGGSK